MATPTRNQIINEVTDAYIENLRTKHPPPPPEQVAEELTEQMEDRFLVENLNRGRNRTLPVPNTILLNQVAQLMLEMYHIANITCGGPNANPAYDLLAVYMDDGPDKGLYVESDKVFHRIARRFNRRLLPEECDKIIKILQANAPRIPRTMDPDLIAVNNGIFNYDTKELMPFSPEYVFMAKSRVNYNPKAHLVKIHNPKDNTDWDVESWIDELSDDPEIVDLIWQILGAIVRPFVRWNKSAWFYSDKGNNGKGTLCVLMRNLCGSESVAAIPLSDFSKNFALEPLTRSTAIIVDENDVGVFIDKAANLKAVITNDVISIDRKFKSPISYQFFGFMVQCLNEFPRLKDKSDSFYRRQLFVPFEKCFTGRERTYIKDDYLNRQEVLEYVLYRVLNMRVYQLSEPQRCKDVLAEYKEYNDPVRQFFDEFETQFRWDLLPFQFLYDLYKAWSAQNNPKGIIQGRYKFTDELLNVIKNSTIWYCKDRHAKIRPSNRMKCPEPLVLQYNLKDWMDSEYQGGGNPLLMARPNEKYLQESAFRGLLRNENAPRPSDEPDWIESTT